MRGDFLDVIFDCPYELHELTSDRYISEILRNLNENQMEVLYYRVIRQWSVHRTAVMRGQTERNIRKVYGTLIAGLRRKVFERLYPRFEANLPLTLTQREFVMSYVKKRSTRKIWKFRKKFILDEKQ